MTRYLLVLLTIAATLSAAAGVAQEKTEKPPLHGKHWMAITGKPLGATAGAKMFERGGNAVDAACAMIAATATQWDTLHWGGETQALIWHPGLKKVIAINALGVAPTGATPEFFRSKGMDYPPEHGPLAAVTPGTPGGIMVMLAEYGRLSLAEVLAPAIEMADGFGLTPRAFCCRIATRKAKVARRRAPARFSFRRSSPRRCVNSSMPNDVHSHEVRPASRRSWLPTTDSIAAISRTNSPRPCKPREV